MARAIGPVGICSIGTDLAVPTVNYVGDALGLVCNSVECSLISTNKYEMRRALSAASIPVPAFQVVSGLDLDEINSFDFPVIIKPVDRSGSRGVAKVTNRDELPYAVSRALRESFSRRAIVEEFVSGTEFSVEMISQDGEHFLLQITEKFTTGAPGFVEIGHRSPAAIPATLKERISQTIKRALTALRVENGASHSELMVLENGDLRIIEIGSRMGGDFIGSDMVPLSTGFDFVGGVIDVAVGRKLREISTVLLNHAIVRFVFDEGDARCVERFARTYPDYVVRTYRKTTFNETVADSSETNGYLVARIPADMDC